MTRPNGSNADEWQLFLIEHADNAAYCAVQVAEAIEAAERRMREALAPFAVIGGLINLCGEGDSKIPDETIASYMRLDGLTAKEFRAAHKAYAGD